MQELAGELKKKSSLDVTEPEIDGNPVACNIPLFSEEEDMGVLMENEQQGEDQLERVDLMVEQTEVEMIMEEGAGQDRIGLMSSAERPQSTTTRRPLAPTIASRISELRGRAGTGSPVRRRSRPGSAKSNKKVLDLSNCQRIDDFMLAMGGRKKEKRKAIEGDQEGDEIVVKRMRGT